MRVGEKDNLQVVGGGGVWRIWREFRFVFEEVFKKVRGDGKWFCS